MAKKLVVEFELHNEQMDEMVNKALITLLMTTIAQIGIRVDTPENTDDIIEEETKDVKENQ